MTTWSERRKAVQTQSQATMSSEFYLLVGKKVLNPETDEIEFIQIPQPLYLDTMKRNTVSGEGAFQELLLAQNDLLDDLLDNAKVYLKPGEQIEDDELIVKICRKKASQETNHVKRKFEFACFKK